MPVRDDREAGKKLCGGKSRQPSRVESDSPETWRLGEVPEVGEIAEMKATLLTEPFGADCTKIIIDCAHATTTVIVGTTKNEVIARAADLLIPERPCLCAL